MGESHLTMNYEDLIGGLMWLVAGILILLNWRWLVQSAIHSGDSFWGRLGIPQASEKSRRIGGEIIAKLLGSLLILFGLLQLYAFVTGQKIVQ